MKTLSKYYVDNDIKHYTIANTFQLDMDSVKCDKELQKICGNRLKNIGEETIEYTCFNYAFDDYDLEYLEEGIEYLFYNYKLIDLKNAKQDDIIVYCDIDQINHFAKILKTDGTVENTIVRAKFGAWGLYEHTLNNTPTLFGDTITIWKRKDIK